VSVGTRSVLFGVHAFWLHPFFTAEAWRRIYGFPWDVRLWVAFFVHDLGYWKKNDMEGREARRTLRRRPYREMVFWRRVGRVLQVMWNPGALQEFFWAAGDVGPGQGAASPLPGQQCRS